MLTGAEIEGLVDASAEHGVDAQAANRDMLRGSSISTTLTVADVMIHRKNIKSLDIDPPRRAKSSPRP